MLILLVNIYSYNIHIIGRWYRKNILHYLHVTMCPIIQGRVVTMVSYGDYNFIISVTLLTAAVGTAAV